MIDKGLQTATIQRAGREDRAILRRNPSARPGAQAWWGVSRHGTRPPALQPTPCFGVNAINLNPRYSAKTPPHWLAVRHMSTSSWLSGAENDGYHLLDNLRLCGELRLDARKSLAQE